MINEIEDHFSPKKDEKKECRQFIIDTYINLGLDKIQLIEKRIFTLTKNLEFFKETFFLTEQALNYKQENFLTKINEKIENSKWKNNDLLRHFKPICHIQIGHKLDSIPDIEKINGEKEIRQFNLEEGKVCLIYIWSYFKSITKKQLRYLNELFEENNWEGSVKFLTFNSDTNREYTQKYLKTLNVNKMEHFYIDNKKHPEHPLLKVGEIHGFSTCILVNNDNIIDYCGTLYEVDLAKKINLMLERNLVNQNNSIPINCIEKADKNSLKKIVKKIESITVKTDENFWEEEKMICNIKTFNRQLSRSLSLNQINITAPHLCEAKIIINKIFITGNIKNYFYSGEIEYKCHIDDEKEMTALFKGTEQIKNLKFSKKIIETKEFYFGEACNRCNTYLYDMEDHDNIFPQFFCPICEVYFCRDCGNELTNLNSNKKLHNHFLFYLTNHTRNYMKYILKHNLKNDSEFEFKYFLDNKNFDYMMKDMKYHYHIKCDGCFSYPIKTYRWKCCVCEYKNICEICMNIMESNILPFAGEIENNLELTGCDYKKHVFMKIIFDASLYK